MAERKKYIFFDKKERILIKDFDKLFTTLSNEKQELAFYKTVYFTYLIYVFQMQEARVENKNDPNNKIIIEANRNYKDCKAFRNRYLKELAKLYDYETLVSLHGSVNNDFLKTFDEVQKNKELLMEINQEQVKEGEENEM